MDYSLSSDQCSVTLRGQFVFNDHPEFRKLAELIFDGTTQAICFDLSGLDFVDSAGLGMLLIVREEALKANRRIILKGACGQVKKLFDLSRFDTLFTLEP